MFHRFTALGASHTHLAIAVSWFGCWFCFVGFASAFCFACFAIACFNYHSRSAD